MRTSSGSCRCVVNRDWPGRRRSSQGWMSASDSAMRGGQPSTTQPMAGPWLSPQVVTRNRWPKLLCDMGSATTDASCHQVAPVIRHRDMQETLFAVVEARDVAAARGVLHQHDLTRLETGEARHRWFRIQRCH